MPLTRSRNYYALGIRPGGGKKLISDYSAGMTKKIARSAALIHSPLACARPRRTLRGRRPPSPRPISAKSSLDYTRRGTVILVLACDGVTVQRCARTSPSYRQGGVLVAGNHYRRGRLGRGSVASPSLVGGVHSGSARRGWATDSPQAPHHLEYVRRQTAVLGARDPATAVGPCM